MSLSGAKQLLDSPSLLTFFPVVNFGYISTTSDNNLIYVITILLVFISTLTYLVFEGISKDDIDNLSTMFVIFIVASILFLIGSFVYSLYLLTDHFSPWSWVPEALFITSIAFATLIGWHIALKRFVPAYENTI